jgi:hypothetical protein
MGYDVSCTKARIDGKHVRYYTAVLNPDIACVLQRREQLGIATHLDNSVHSENPHTQICGMGKWVNISLGENDKFPCHKTYADRLLADHKRAGVKIESGEMGKYFLRENDNFP